MAFAERIVIVGFGWVGQANALALTEAGNEVYYFDPQTPEHHYDNAATYERIKRLSQVNEMDSPKTSYIVCVGDRVSEDGIQDTSSIEAALRSLRGVNGTVILRSTILPDTLEKLSFDFYVPEFLHEKKAVEECRKPYYFVIGTTGSGRERPAFLSAWKENAHHTFEGTPREASYIKYLSNLWNAARIAFVNEFGDSIVLPKTKEDLASIERVTDFIFARKPYTRYGRSFSGHCLPKDMRAFKRWNRDRGVSSHLFDGIYASNDTHAALQDRYSVMPEWYSEWRDPQPSGYEALKIVIRAVGRKLRRPFSMFGRA